MQLITRNVKLNFAPGQYEYWSDLLETAMACYNDISELIFENHCPLGPKSVHRLVYHPMRKKYPSLPAQVVIKVYRDVIANMKACKCKEAPKQVNPSIQLDERLFSNLTPYSINLVSPIKRKRVTAGFILYDDFNRLAANHKMSDPTICKKGDVIYLCVPFQFEEKPVVNEKKIGCDMGKRRIYTTSEGVSNKATNFKRRQRRIRFQKRQLQSKKTKNARRKLKRVKHKERNMTKAFVHEVCNEILSMDAGTIVIEDLKGIKQNTSRDENGKKRRKHNNSFSQAPLYMIRQTLTYKAPLVGKRVETVSPRFTSQIDCATGKKDGSRRGCRYYSKGGKVYDADWNAAINILNRKHPSPFRLPLDGGLNFVGQGPVNDPNDSGVPPRVKPTGLQPGGS